MIFLLDTNVVSEWVKPVPDPNVVKWLGEVDEDQVFLSVVSLAEIRRGVELMDSGRRRTLLTDWLTGELPARFEGRILEVDRRVAEAWGVLMAHGHKAGLNLGSLDAFFAATANVHRLTLVTRNVQHFNKLGLSLLNPWQHGQA
jgi:predicted nucleic acid-binding protein